MVWVSKRAFDAMEMRKTPIAAFYANLSVYKSYYEDKWFPYTMPISDIKGLRAALENWFEDKNVFERHEKIAKATREALIRGGIELYLESGFSNNVTVINVPDGIKDTDILDGMVKDYGIMISGCFDCLAGKVVRIGHMGENARKIKVAETLHALQGTLEKSGVKVKCNLEQAFLECLAK